MQPIPCRWCINLVSPGARCCCCCGSCRFCCCCCWAQNTANWHVS